MVAAGESVKNAVAELETGQDVRVELAEEVGAGHDLVGVEGLVVAGVGKEGARDEGKGDADLWGAGGEADGDVAGRLETVAMATDEFPAAIEEPFDIDFEVGAVGVQLLGNFDGDVGGGEFAEEGVTGCFGLRANGVGGEEDDTVGLDLAGKAEGPRGRVGGAGVAVSDGCDDEGRHGVEYRSVTIAMQLSRSCRVFCRC